MTQPDFTPKPTQSKYPWRATFRTVVAALLGLLPLLPTIADAAGISTVAIVAVVLAVAGAVTRVLAIPGLDVWLRKYLPWLATQPGTAKNIDRY